MATLFFFLEEKGSPQLLLFLRQSKGSICRGSLMAEKVSVSLLCHPVSLIQEVITFCLLKDLRLWDCSLTWQPKIPFCLPGWQEWPISEAKTSTTAWLIESQIVTFGQQCFPPRILEMWVPTYALLYCIPADIHDMFVCTDLNSL